MIAWMFLLATAAAPDSAAKATETLAASCLDHKFETTVQVTGRDGRPRASKVKLCGKPGQSDAEWLVTLKDALEKVVLDPKMAKSAKDQVITALNAEIARLEPAKPAAAEATPTAAAPLIAAPSLAAAPPPQSVVTERLPEYSTYKPLPPPKPVASAAVAAAGSYVAASPAVPTLPAPRLTLRCLGTQSIAAEGPCNLLEREMLVTVRADETIPAGTSLRFLRRGDDRAEIALATLRRGQSQRFTLPPRVCQGVAGSMVEIQIVRRSNSGPQVVDTRGPFELRC